MNYGENDEKKESATAKKETFYGLRSWYFASGEVIHKRFETRQEVCPLSCYVHCDEYDVYEEYFITAEARERAFNAGRTTTEEIERNGMGTCPIDGTDHTAVYYRKVIE